MAISNYYVDYSAGNDTTGNGTIGTPWKTIQKACDSITRNATDGDQINVKAGTAQVLAASLTLATYGTPNTSAPLVLRGYTSAANDAGVGVVDCGGVTMFASTYSAVVLADLQCHTFGDTNGITLGSNVVLFRCNLHKGASSPSNKYILTVGATSLVIGCYLHDLGTTGKGINGVTGLIIWNYITGVLGVYGIASNNGHIISNIVCCAATGAIGIYHYGATGTAIGNTVYNSTAGTASGINVVADGILAILNNVVEGWSGVGGVGIKPEKLLFALGFNAYYNNTTPLSKADVVALDQSGSDVALGASPFTNKAGGDFSVGTALKALGFPAAFNGSGTNNYVDIGAAQRQEPAAGGGSRPYPTFGLEELH